MNYSIIIITKLTKFSTKIKTDKRNLANVSLRVFLWRSTLYISIDYRSFQRTNKNISKVWEFDKWISRVLDSTCGGLSSNFYQLINVKVWNMFEHPASSMAARFIGMFSIFCIFVSTAILTLDTLPYFQVIGRFMVASLLFHFNNGIGIFCSQQGNENVLFWFIWYMIYYISTLMKDGTGPTLKTNVFLYKPFVFSSQALDSYSLSCSWQM